MHSFSLVHDIIIIKQLVSRHNVNHTKNSTEESQADIKFCFKCSVLQKLTNAPDVKQKIDTRPYLLGIQKNARVNADFYFKNM